MTSNYNGGSKESAYMLGEVGPNRIGVFTVPLSGLVRVDSVANNGDRPISVSVEEDDRLASSPTKGHAVTVEVQPPGTATFITEEGRLTVRAWAADCESINIGVPGGALAQSQGLGGLELNTTAEGVSGLLPATRPGSVRPEMIIGLGAEALPPL